MLFNAELMPRRRRGGMGWETWQSDSEAEARGKKRPSCARIGRLKPAPPRQVTGELMPRQRRGGMGWETWQRDSEAEARGKKRPSCARIGRRKRLPHKSSVGQAPTV